MLNKTDKKGPPSNFMVHRKFFSSFMVRDLKKFGKHWILTFIVNSNTIYLKGAKKLKLNRMSRYTSAKLKQFLMIGSLNWILVFDKLNLFTSTVFHSFLTNKTNIFFNFKTVTRTLPFNTLWCKCYLDWLLHGSPHSFSTWEYLILSETFGKK